MPSWSIPPVAEAAEATSKATRDAASALGLQINALNAATAGEIDAAFVDLGGNCVPARSPNRRIDDILFFNARREQFVALAARSKECRRSYEGREFAAAGGLMSYGASLPEAWGARPASTSA